MIYRPLVIASLAGLLASCGYPESTESESATKLDQVRRIVTSEDANGKAIILSDGPTPNAVELNGSRIERLWETGALPAPIPVTEDAGANAGNAYREGFVGTSLYTADLPPGSNLEDIPIHAQDSLDYIALLEGEIELILEDGEAVTMYPGDVLVQAGNMHSWINKTDRPARLLVVVLTGQRAQQDGSE